MPTLLVNNIPVTVPDGASVLKAAQTAGVNIPTLCFLEGLDAIGACRVCVVEVEGAKALVASCSMPAAEGMKVHTNTPRVRAARRSVVELLLSEHDGDCQTCERNEDCELQEIASDLGISSVTYAGERTAAHVDASTAALVRNNSKCIKCRRCVTVCNQVQNVGALFPQARGFKTVIGPAFASDLAKVTCVQCGQCAAVCPVGAIVEQNHIQRTWEALDDPAKTVVVQTAPAVRAALGECFGHPAGTLVTGKMVAALRRLGFKTVFDTNFTADLTIIEEGTELLVRLKKALVDKERVALPQFTSCSPGWINFMEHFHPDMLPMLSSCKSPQQMFGALAKTYWAQKVGKKPEDVFVVSVMPCTAKKFESQRPEMNSSGFVDVDAVLTTRELGRMIKQAGIDFNSLPDEDFDRVMGVSTGAADIFANTGGVMEAALRFAYTVVTGRPLPFDELHVEPIAGLDGIKEASLTITGAVPDWSFLEGATLKVAVAHGLGNANKVVQRVKDGTASYHFVEVMTCPGGCIGGGGQPRLTCNAKRKERIKAIYQEDENKKLRSSQDNPKIKQVYGEFLTIPLGKKSHHLLHTKYAAKTRV
jgi:NADP-reducing hydrogenase subunit HndD